MPSLPGRASRRAFVTGGAAALLLPSAALPASTADAVAALERRHGGRLGVHALDLETRREVAHRADERFKLMSSFKALIAAKILTDVAGGTDTLDATVRYGRADLIDGSPVTQANVATGAMTVRALCEAMMARSDNSAANLLLARHGGPAALTAYLRGIGDGVTRIDNYEGHLDGPSAIADTTTPRAITATMRTLLLGPALAAADRAQWRAWMEGNLVGGARLRARFPSEWRAGDRTGTADGICNDIAFALRPRRAPLLLSVYYAAPGMTTAAQEAVLRDVARLVVAWQDTRR